MTLLFIPVKVYKKEKEEFMDEDYKKLAGVFLLGGLIGAVIALLYAPKSGRETRKDISKVARRVKKETSELIDDTIDNIHDFAGSIKDKVSDIIERGVELSESAKKEILKNLEHGQKVIEKQKKRITEAIGL